RGVHDRSSGPARAGLPCHQQFAQRHPRPEQPRAHRVHRNRQHLRDFLVAQFLVFPQQQDFPLRGLQPRHRVAHPRRSFRLRRLRRLPRAPRAARLPARFSSLYVQHPHRDAVEIGAKERPRLVARRAFQYGDKDVLRQFLGPRRLVQSPPEEAVEPLRVALEQLRERLCGALLKLEHQLFIAGHKAPLPFRPGLPCGWRLSGALPSLPVMPRVPKKFPGHSGKGPHLSGLRIVSYAEPGADQVYSNGMSTPHKCISIGSLLVLFVAILYPPWLQTHGGWRLPYRGELGHHFLWLPPAPTGEQSWMGTVPASECEVSIQRGVLLRQCGSIIAMATILLIAFRGWPNARLTPGKLSLTSLLLAVCLPVWPPDGDPLALWVGLAATCPFTDCGEFGTHGAAQLAGAVLAV